MPKGKLLNTRHDRSSHTDDNPPLDLEKGMNIPYRCYNWFPGVADRIA